jgi:hypothetical protein
MVKEANIKIAIKFFCEKRHVVILIMKVNCVKSIMHSHTRVMFYVIVSIDVLTKMIIVFSTSSPFFG